MSPSGLYVCVSELCGPVFILSHFSEISFLLRFSELCHMFAGTCFYLQQLKLFDIPYALTCSIILISKLFYYLRGSYICLKTDEQSDYGI
jgi:hypothetical protein